MLGKVQSRDHEWQPRDSSADNACEERQRINIIEEVGSRFKIRKGYPYLGKVYENARKMDSESNDVGTVGQVLLIEDTTPPRQQSAQ